MPKYRGSPMSGGNFWGREIGFAKGQFSRAAPHLSNAPLKAQPHAITLALKAMESVLDSAIEKVQEKLKSGQQGKGIKGRRRKVSKPKPKSKITQIVRRAWYLNSIPDKF